MLIRPEKDCITKQTEKKKVLFGLEMFAWAFICVVIVAWIGYSAYVKSDRSQRECGSEYSNGYYCT